MASMYTYGQARSSHPIQQIATLNALLWSYRSQNTSSLSHPQRRLQKHPLSYRDSPSCWFLMKCIWFPLYQPGDSAYSIGNHDWQLCCTHCWYCHTLPSYQLLANQATSDCIGFAAGLKWLQREGYDIVDTCAKNKLPLNKLKISYDSYNQKLYNLTLQFHVPSELGRKLPGLPVLYDECGMIYVCTPDINKEKFNI